MKFSVIFTLDVPAGHNLSIPGGPEWEVFEGNDKARNEVWSRGQHRALSAVLEEQKLLELIYWYGATHLDAAQENNTIKLSVDGNPALLCDIYVTPEAENYDQQAWDRFVKRFERRTFALS